ncbi:metal ABC transporter ATP-binding protein [Candidatus Saccharibacteria bacterium]|nr:metal ABC transporter ATP-binding protein [Candidatus Saccharibacteria bacterium]
MNHAILAKNVSINYGSNKVINSASFVIDEQDFVCIVGANGSGKSTLIKAILGLIKPKAGTISFGEGIDQRSIGFLPQDVKVDLNFPSTVLEIVLSGTLGRLGMKAFYRKSDKLKATEAMKRLGIAKLQDASFPNLSGGQKQKVLLARALTATSKILILDEPSNNLDYKSRKEFYDELKNLNKSGLTIIMITHDLDAEDLIGNKVISIKESKVECCSTSDYLRNYR